MNEPVPHPTIKVMMNQTVFVLKAVIVPFLLVSSVWAPRSLLGQDGQAYEALYAASDRYYGLETLCAHFRQEVELTLRRRTIRSEGTVCMQQPDRFSMDYSDPDGDVLIVDGEFAWRFNPSTDDKQVIRCSVEGGGGGNNFFSTVLDNPRGRFEAVHEGREPMGEGVSHKIALTPKETGGAVEFRSAVVWLHVDSNFITALEIRDTNEQIRRLWLTNIRVGIEIPQDVFRFVPPGGTHVFTPPGCEG